MQTRSRRNDGDDIFEERMEYKDLSDVSACACYSDTSWETNAFEVASRSTATRFRENVLSARSFPAGYPGYFPRIWIHVLQTPTCSCSAPSLAESFTRFLALSHFSVTNFAGVESLYRHLWANTTTTMISTRFQQRIVAEKSFPSSRRRYILSWNTDWFT